MLAGISIDRTLEVEARQELEQTVAEKEKLARGLEASQAMFRIFMHHNPNHVFIKSEEGKYLFYNRSLADFFGIDETAWLGKRDEEVLSPEQVIAFKAHDQDTLDSMHPVEVSERLVDARGQEYFYKAIKFAITGASGERMVAGVALNISAEVKHQQQLADSNRKLEMLAGTDALTGLLNRRAFEGRLHLCFHHAKENQLSLTLFMLDLDDFKLRNDRFGHAAGDDALRRVGEMLSPASLPECISGRLGGEEFALAVPGLSADLAVAFAESLQKKLASPADLSDALTASIGVASLQADTASWERLLRHADDAMYEAKRAGKNRVVQHIAQPGQVLLEHYVIVPTTPPV